MNATSNAIEVGSRVCRKANADQKIVGTVVGVGRTHARVKWDRSQMGLVRLTTGKSQNSLVSLDDLVPEGEFTPRQIDKPTEDAYRPCFLRLDWSNGSGVCEYGRNAWTFSPEEEEKALDMARRMAGEGKHVKLQRRDEASIVPARCRTPRVFSRWVTLFQS